MEKVYDFLEKKLKLKNNDTIVIGVSGGPDSMALLDVLIKLKKKLNISIIVGHVNHNLRVESAEEYAWIEKFCTNENIIFEGMKIESYGEDNFHNEARTIRYNYFNDLINKYKAQYLFTAHHADDLIETILMRIVRGSTLKGYSGFAEIINKDTYEIVRPLIGVTKDEILDYCQKVGITYFVDSSNNKDKYTRNRFRKYILPALKDEDASVHNKFKKFSDTLTEYNNYIDKQVDKVINKIIIDNSIKIDELEKQENIIKTRIINRFLENIYSDDIMLISDEHVLLIMKLIDSKKKNAYVMLPDGIKIVKEYNLVKILLNTGNNSYEIEIDKLVTLNNGGQIEVVQKEDKDSNYVCRLSKEEVLFPLRVRTREDGDKMLVKGLNGHKKINDIFIDNKIASSKRNNWPIVVDSNNVIVWLPGLKKSKFDKTKNEKYDIILRYY